MIKLIVIYICLPLILGVIIYALCRPQHTVIACYFHKSPTCLPKWIAYNLPDALWLFSFLSAIQIIWGKVLREKYLWLSVIVIASIGTEYLQNFHIIPGTFDTWDIVAYLLATIANLFIFRTSTFK